MRPEKFGSLLSEWVWCVALKRALIVLSPVATQFAVKSMSRRSTLSGPYTGGMNAGTAGGSGIGKIRIFGTIKADGESLFVAR